MEHPSKLKLLLREWRWLFGTTLLLALPTYGFTVPLRYAFICNTAAVLLYVVVLLIYGPGHVIEGALFVLVLVIPLAILSGPLHRAKQKQKRLIEQRRNATTHSKTEMPRVVLGYQNGSITARNQTEQGLSKCDWVSAGMPTDAA